MDEDQKQIYRDEVVAELVRMAIDGRHTSDEVRFDQIHEAIRDSIDIDHLKKMLDGYGVSFE